MKIYCSWIFAELVLLDTKFTVRFQKDHFLLFEFIFLRHGFRTPG